MIGDGIEDMHLKMNSTSLRCPEDIPFLSSHVQMLRGQKYKRGADPTERQNSRAWLKKKVVGNIK